VIVPPPPSSAVALVDAQHGWVGGVGGLYYVARSLNGDPQAVSFVDARNGWVVTPHCHWTTTDGGAHWHRAAHVP
jgi:hypothetical protein